MNGDLAPLLQGLCEFDPPEMSRQWIDRHELRESINALISCGALVLGKNASSVFCERCDVEHWIVPEYLERGRYRGFCPVSGYHCISAKSLQCFVIDETWIGGGIAAALGIRLKKSQSDRSQPVLSIGRARFGPYTCELFFGRRLHDRSKLERAVALVTETIGLGPAIMLTSTKKELLSGLLPERCAVIRIENVLAIVRGKISFDEAPILAALRGPVPLPREGGIGFRHSPGFRICAFGSEEFRFSKKQALIVEVLHDARREGLSGVHQDELKGSVEIGQRIVQLFNRHPAYGTLIKNDGKGFYWLDL
jgi:hypothetical protein